MNVVVSARSLVSSSVYHPRDLGSNLGTGIAFRTLTQQQYEIILKIIESQEQYGYKQPERIDETSSSRFVLRIS
ncbi:hypothetical protein J6590_100581 [Homalodisca vitripennis]|nr:hypothetical protein J6590_100581 [Homalodisca vitripennis]